MPKKLRIFLDTIKFEHTLFALPFAYMGLFLGERGLPDFSTFFWVTIAMIGLRTVGMIANRLADIDFDRENPRTQNWPLSLGLISKNSLIFISVPALFLYFCAAAMLNPLCFFLSPIPCAMIFIYPYLKRITWISHIFLGGILGLAPLGGWAASQGIIAFEPVPLGLSVLFWVSGFDILYALQDEEFDRKKGLFSIPASFGRTSSFVLAAGLHLAAVLCLVWLGSIDHMGPYYWGGVILAGMTIVGEHLQLHIKGLKHVPKIFFIPNVSFSVIIFIGAWLDLILR